MDLPTIRGRSAPRIETIIERAEEGKELSGAELELLLQLGLVEKERIFEAVSEAVKDDSEE